MSELSVLDLKDFKVVLDPNTNFWAAYDGDAIPSEVLELYSDARDILEEKMRRYRFEVKFNTVYLNVTEKCNANCPYCYIPEKIRKRGGSMGYGQLEDILTKLKEMDVEWVVFHGAEPLTEKKLIFRAIEDFDFNFGIQTNGFLLTEGDVEFVKENGVNLGVSFDSPIPEIEDFLRGKGHHTKILRILEWVDGYEKFNVITTITKYNHRQLPDLIDLLAGKVNVVLMNPVRGTSGKARELRADAVSAATEFIKAVERAIDHTRNGKRIVVGDFANIVLGIIAPTSRILQCDISPCGAGRRFFAISVDGIYPCGEFIGMDEFRTDFHANLENSDEFKAVRMRIAERINECATCPLRNICGSPCPAEVYAENGSLFVKSPYCEFYKKVIEHAFRVIVRGDADKVVRVDRMREIYRVQL